MSADARALAAADLHTDEALAQAGDYLARTALKVLFDAVALPEVELDPTTELELTDAVAAWTDARRDAAGRGRPAAGEH